MRSENLTPTQAAEMILGFYDHIPAINPEAFVAGLVEILSNYPQTVVDQATSPSKGLAGAISYPNLAKFREKLDEWAAEHYEQQDRILRAEQRKLLPPEEPTNEERMLRPSVQEMKAEYGGENWGMKSLDRPEVKFELPTKERLAELSKHYRQYGLAFQPKQQAAE